jgi:aerobic-type carbon monoxide dehydrogenase small subunit (CoxS/CutS family)
MPQFRLTVNGKQHIVDTHGERPLLEVLREDLGLTGTKYGCGEGQCRACTVLIDGKAAISCVTPVRAVAGKKIATIESIATASKLHRVQQAFLEEGAFQCGYCTPGMVMRTVALLGSNPRPTETQVIDALDGSICRCCSYPRIVAAVRRASI